MIEASGNNGEKSMNVLLVGNNPTEISGLYSSLKSFENPRFNTDTAFHFNNIFRRIIKFRPASILIDDRFNRTKLNRLIKRIHRNPRTRDIPVTLLKSNNEDLGLTADIDNYVLKENLSAENLYFTILNSRRLRRTSIYLYKSYKKSRGLLQKIWLDLRRMYWWIEQI